MDWARCRKLMWRWSLLTAALIAAFWTIWAIFLGPVPIVIDGPFPMSRWWDVLIGPILTAMIIGSYCAMQTLDFALADGRIYEPVFWLLYAPVWGLAYGLGLGLIFFGLAFGLIFALAYALVSGLVCGLLFWLFFGLAYGLIWPLTMLVKYVFSLNFWAVVGNWLMAKN